MPEKARSHHRPSRVAILAQDDHCLRLARPLPAAPPRSPLADDHLVQLLRGLLDPGRR
ncbi:hypothetical protein [Alkalilimnicola sp. S0819]|uniref:hypothetical protein n=1 Tax=Alkalilimnicola sp. S0819 TaxID=2613922 RepID=UPI00186A7916|nr:hypothetical protein [Alkalilimnicola sp. S0819]